MYSYGRAQIFVQVDSHVYLRGQTEHASMTTDKSLPTVTFESLHDNTFFSHQVTGKNTKTEILWGSIFNLRDGST